MTEKPHIVRVVADEARQRLYRHHERGGIPRPRMRDEEIGVEFENGEFIPYADLGYSRDTGFFRISEEAGLYSEAAPYAATGHLIDCGQIILTTAASRRLTNEEIRDLLDRHASGDFGEFGEFYNLDIDDSMLCDEQMLLPPGLVNKVNTLTGRNAIISAYTVGENRIWLITEAGENRTTVILFAGKSEE